MIITIDGPAGAGKSTVAQALARRLGFRYLDTGSMYRAVALAALRGKVRWDRPEELTSFLRSLDIQVANDRVLLDGEDVSEAIRSSEVTAATRFAADNPEVRQLLTKLQRAVAEGQDIVTEGRDQGTVVFPEAECKVFLTATPAERAARRLKDLTAQGENKTFEEVLSELTGRDKQDAARPYGPLMAAPDAIEVLTDGMSIEQVVECLESIVQQRQSARPQPPNPSDHG